MAFVLFYNGGHPPSWFCYAHVWTTHKVYSLCRIWLPWTRCSSFDNIQVSILRVRLEMPIHASKIGSFGAFPPPPQCGEQYHFVRRRRVGIPAVYTDCVQQASWWEQLCTKAFVSPDSCKILTWVVLTSDLPTVRCSSLCFRVNIATSWVVVFDTVMQRNIGYFQKQRKKWSCYYE